MMNDIPEVPSVVLVQDSCKHTAHTVSAPHPVSIATSSGAHQHTCAAKREFTRHVIIYRELYIPRRVKVRKAELSDGARDTDKRSCSGHGSVVSPSCSY